MAERTRPPATAKGLIYQVARFARSPEARQRGNRLVNDVLSAHLGTRVENVEVRPNTMVVEIDERFASAFRNEFPDATLDLPHSRLGVTCFKVPIGEPV